MLASAIPATLVERKTETGQRAKSVPCVTLSLGLASVSPSIKNKYQISFRQQFADHAGLLATVEADCSAPLARLVEVCANCLASRGKIFFFGNGGSAADAQHMAAELCIRFVNDRRALAALALTTDSSVLTACGNDLGFEWIFSRQIEALGNAGDVAIAFTTSGLSPNILRGLESARDLGLIAAAFSGNQGGRLVGIADPLLLVPSATTARIQEMHILLGHLLCEAIERSLGLE